MNFRVSVARLSKTRAWKLLLAACFAFFVPTTVDAQLDAPDSAESWQRHRDEWMQQLREQAFTGWPAEDLALEAKTAFEEIENGVELRAIDFVSSSGTELRLYITHFPGLRSPDLVVLNPLDHEGWQDFLATMRPGFEEQLKAFELPEADEEAFQQMKGMYRSFKWSMAYIAPRGIGSAAADAEADSPQHGLDEMQVWDIRRAIQAMRSEGGMPETQIWLQGQGAMAANTLCAALFEPDLHRLDLYDLPESIRPESEAADGRKIVDIHQFIAIALERTEVIVYEQEPRDWSDVIELTERLGWPQTLKLRKPPTEQ